MKISLGVVGLGQLAREVHLPILSSIPDIEVTALADPSTEALSAAKHFAPRAQLYSSVNDLLSKTPVDAVLIASPTGEHANHAREAIDANKPVYLEKPIASEMSDAEALYEHAVRRNAHVTVGFNYRFHPLIARRRQQIQSAEVQKAR